MYTYSERKKDVSSTTEEHSTVNSYTVSSQVHERISLHRAVRKGVQRKESSHPSPDGQCTGGPAHCTGSAWVPCMIPKVFSAPICPSHTGVCPATRSQLRRGCQGCQRGNTLLTRLNVVSRDAPIFRLRSTTAGLCTYTKLFSQKKSYVH